MKSVRLSEAKARLSELVDEVRTGGEPILIQKRDKGVAVIVELEHFQRLQQLEDRMRSLRLREALKGKTYPLKDVLAELGFGV